MLLWKKNCINWGFLKDYTIHYLAYFFNPLLIWFSPQFLHFFHCFTVTSPENHPVLCFTYCLKPAQVTIWNWTFLSKNIYLPQIHQPTTSAPSDACLWKVNPSKPFKRIEVDTFKCRNTVKTCKLYICIWHMRKLLMDDLQEGRSAFTLEGVVSSCYPSLTQWVQQKHPCNI